MHVARTNWLAYALATAFSLAACSADDVPARGAGHPASSSAPEGAALPLPSLGSAAAAGAPTGSPSREHHPHGDAGAP